MVSLEVYPFYATALLLFSVSILIRRRRSALNRVEKVSVFLGFAGVILGFTDGALGWKIVAVVIIGLLIYFLDSITGKKVKKRLGKPCKIDHNMQIYLSRQDLEFRDIVGIAKEEIIFVSVTHEMAAADKESAVRDAIINRNIRVKVYLLRPDSDYVSHKEHVFGTGVFAEGDPDLEKDLKTRIEESLQKLTYFRNSLPKDKVDNLIIEKYDSDIPASLMIIDHITKNGHVNANACIKIEEHFERSRELSRQNKVVFYKDNPSYYEKCYDDYLRINEHQSLAPIR